MEQSWPFFGPVRRTAPVQIAVQSRGQPVIVALVVVVDRAEDEPGAGPVLLVEYGEKGDDLAKINIYNHVTTLLR